MSEKDLRKDIVDFFVEFLKSDDLSFKEKWVNKIKGLPFNAATSTKYTGINSVGLMTQMLKRGYSLPRFATFNQIKDNKWALKKGSKAFIIEYPVCYIYRKDEDGKIIPVKKGLQISEIDKEYKDLVEIYPEDSLIKQIYINHHFVFNEQDIDGIPGIKYPEAKKYDNSVLNDIAASLDVKIIDSYNNKAFYNRNNDSIYMPLQDNFNSQYDYQSVLAHELTHATGVEKRLNRKEYISYHDSLDNRAKEELNAEITSMLLMSEFNLDINFSNIENHAAYVASWLKFIESNPNYLMDAIKNAYKISGYFKDSYSKYLEKQIIQKENEKVDLSIFSKEQLEQIELAKQEKLDIKHLANPELSPQQMSVILSGLKDGIDVSLFSNPKNSDDTMYLQYLLIKNGFDKAEDLTYLSNVFYKSKTKELFWKFIKDIKAGDIDLEKIKLADKKISKDAIKQEKHSKPFYDEYNKKSLTTDQICDLIPIIDYAEYLGKKVIPESKGFRYHLADHDSLKIFKTNTFTWYSQTTSKGKHIGGNIINFIQTFDPKAQGEYKKAFELARRYISENKLSEPLNMYKNSKAEDIFTLATNKTLYKEYFRLSSYGSMTPDLPQRSLNNEMKNVYAYLCKTRGIKAEVVDAWVEKGMLYQDTRNNAVFVQRDYDGVVKNIHIKGTSLNHPYKHDQEESVKITGFYFKGKQNDSLFITESIIDAMSIQSKCSDTKSWLHDNDYLSLQGTNVETLKHYFLTQDTSKLQNVYICTDNDEPGNLCAENIYKIIDEIKDDSKYELNNLHIARLTPNSKDFNQDLVDEIKARELAMNQASQQTNQEPLQSNSIDNNLDNNVSIEM